MSFKKKRICQFLLRKVKKSVVFFWSRFVLFLHFQVSNLVRRVVCMYIYKTILFFKRIRKHRFLKNFPPCKKYLNSYPLVFYQIDHYFFKHIIAFNVVIQCLVLICYDDDDCQILYLLLNYLYFHK